jgi:hypothetical protein
MMRTITIAIGVMVATVFTAMLISNVVHRLLDKDALDLNGLTLSADADTAVIFWETDQDASGQVVYLRHGMSSIARHEGFSRIHRITIPGLDGMVTFMAESCTPDGDCGSSSWMNGSFTLRACGDGSVWDACSGVKPWRCEEGTLVLSCMLCGCPSQQRCVSNGSCVTA